MADLYPHGTSAAYSRHLRYHQVPCRLCTDAEANRTAARRTARAAMERDIRDLVHVLATALGYGRTS